MSIGTAFHNAGSGLAATARLAETISGNVANAMTEGYARRSVELSSLYLGGQGGGVRVVGTARAENAQLTSERRLMQAATGAAATLSEAKDRIFASIGEPGEANSLASRATAFETALIDAAASPSSSAKLGDALDAAKGLIGGLAGAANEAARMRTDAEAEIERQVGVLNSALHDIDGLNKKIRVAVQQGLDAASFEDERTRVIDSIAEILPLRTVKREGGEIALYTKTGGALLDSRVWELSFERSAPVITPEMPSPLSGLFQDRGKGPELVSTEGENAFFGGGSLGALFEVRDSVAVDILREVDLLASDLMSRFQSSSMPVAALDGGEGLFVDAGSSGTPGLAVRLTLNAAVDPAAGGEVRKLRDGLGSASPGPVGFGDYLQAMVDAMTMAHNPGGMLSTGAKVGMAGLASEVGSFFSAQAARADDARAYLSGQNAILTEREAGAVGVDTDSQLQFLMLVEQSYAANARVLSVIDSLLKQLLEI